MGAAGLFNLLFLMALVWFVLYLATSLKRLVHSVERMETLLERRFSQAASVAAPEGDPPATQS